MTTSSGYREFTSTRWSLIASATADSPEGREALERLCEIYWPPIYAYIRRRGFAMDDARDITQDLFEGFIRREGFSSADPQQGRFRSFLLAAVKNLIAEQARNRRTEKRGGRVHTWSIDWTNSENAFAKEPVDERTPEQDFDRRWACQLLDDARNDLDQLNRNPDRQAYYLRLRDFIGIDQNTIRYRELASELGVSESALRVQVHRLRRKFRELLRQRIADTVSDPSEIDDELAYLAKCLARHA